MTEDNTAARPEDILQALRITLAQVLEVAPIIPARVRLNVNGTELDVSWHDPAASAISGSIPVVPVPAADKSEPVDQSTSSVHVVRAPLVGTFFRAPEPGAAPFVEVGDIVARGQQVAIIEAMKLMNAIEATCDGRVVELPVANGSPVEFDQPLVLIDPM